MKRDAVVALRARAEWKTGTAEAPVMITDASDVSRSALASLVTRPASGAFDGTRHPRHAV
jgi:hypothetical protein